MSDLEKMHANQRTIQLSFACEMFRFQLNFRQTKALT